MHGFPANLTPSLTIDCANHSEQAGMAVTAVSFGKVI
jgi:hypothetical protein